MEFLKAIFSKISPLLLYQAWLFFVPTAHAPSLYRAHEPDSDLCASKLYAGSGDMQVPSRALHPILGRLGTVGMILSFLRWGCQQGEIRGGSRDSRSFIPSNRVGRRRGICVVPGRGNFQCHDIFKVR